jgi:hypothetical protein
MNTGELEKQLAAARRRLAQATSDLGVCTATGAACVAEWAAYEHADAVVRELERKLERARRVEAADGRDER